MNVKYKILALLLAFSPGMASDISGEEGKSITTRVSAGVSKEAECYAALYSAGAIYYKKDNMAGTFEVVGFEVDKKYKLTPKEFSDWVFREKHPEWVQKGRDQLFLDKVDTSVSDALQHIRHNCYQYSSGMPMYLRPEKEHPAIESVEIVDFKASTNPTNPDTYNFYLTYRVKMGLEVFDVCYENPRTLKTSV